MSITDVTEAGAQDHADYRWHVTPAEVLLADLADAGLAAEIGPLDVVRAVRRP